MKTQELRYNHKEKSMGNARTFMTILYEKFFRSIRWNTAEAIVYQGILLGHNIALFKVTGQATFGLIGTLFSMLYLTVNLINFGLDTTLGSFFTAITHSRVSFSSLLFYHAMPTIIALTILPFIILSMGFFQQFSGLLLAILIVILITESFKKTVRTLLQLAFLNHITAVLEIASIIIYIVFIWCGYMMAYPITLERIFMPLALLSFITTVIMIVYILRYYRSLPSHSSDTVPSIGYIGRCRMGNYINELSHVAFSGNLLVPLFATQFGFESAGIIKLITSITYAITMCLHKIFGITTQALFSRVKTMQQSLQQEAFIVASRLVNQALIGIVIFFFINHTLIALIHGNMSDSIVQLFLLCLIINCSEYIFVIIEKFFIACERSWILACFNSMVTASMYLALMVVTSYGPIAILTTLLIIRIVSFAIIMTIARKLWNLRSSWHISLASVTHSVIIACTFFIAARILG